MGTGLVATTKSRSWGCGRRQVEHMLVEDTEEGVRHCRIMAKREAAVSVALEFPISGEVRRAWMRDMMRRWNTRIHSEMRRKEVS